MTAPRKRLSADDRREQIVRSARTVFSRTGLAGARTRDIAVEAGVNEALLYRHFASKEELFEAAVAAPLAAAVMRLVDASGAPPEEFDVTAEVMRARTSAFIAELLDVMGEVAPLLGVMLFGQSEASTDYFRTRIMPSLDKIQEVVEINLKAWAHKKFDAELVVQMIFGAAWFLTVSDQLNQRSRDRVTLAEQITAIVIDGLVERNP